VLERAAGTLLDEQTCPTRREDAPSLEGQRGVRIRAAAEINDPLRVASVLPGLPVWARIAAFAYEPEIVIPSRRPPAPDTVHQCPIITGRRSRSRPPPPPPSVEIAESRPPWSQGRIRGRTGVYGCAFRFRAAADERSPAERFAELRTTRTFTSDLKARTSSFDP